MPQLFPDRQCSGARDALRVSGRRRPADPQRGHLPHHGREPPEGALGRLVRHRTSRRAAAHGEPGLPQPGADAEVRPRGRPLAGAQRRRPTAGLPQARRRQPRPQRHGDERLARLFPHHAAHRASGPRRLVEQARPSRRALGDRQADRHHRHRHRPQGRRLHAHGEGQPRRAISRHRRTASSTPRSRRSSRWPGSRAPRSSGRRRSGRCRP